MADTKIEWATKVWNPVTGCTKLSAGCKNCYAAVMFNRLAHNPNAKKYHGRVFTDVQCHSDDLLMPFRWRKPQRVFVNSMSDLFHDDVPFDFLDQVFAVMALNPHHTFMVLTKRPERMREYMAAIMAAQRNIASSAAELRDSMLSGFAALAAFGVKCGEGEIKHPLPNVWMGVTAENQEMANERIPLLLQTPAAMRFASIEPMLGPVDLTDIRIKTWNAIKKEPDSIGINSLYPTMLNPSGVMLDWVICGGESGHHARPMHPDWTRSIRDQCLAAGVPFMFKQWGQWFPQASGQSGRIGAWHDGKFYLGYGDIQNLENNMIRVANKNYLGGHLLDGREHMEVPS